LVVGILGSPSRGRCEVLSLDRRHLVLPRHLLLWLVHHPSMVHLLNHILHVLGLELIVLLGHRVHLAHVVPSLGRSVHLSGRPLSHRVRHRVRSVLDLLLRLPPGLVGLLPLLLLLVQLHALFHIGVQLPTLLGRQLVQLELKDLPTRLVYAVLDHLDDSSLLLTA